mgnify:CR=1 FL=1
MYKKILVTGGNGLVGRAIHSIQKYYPQYKFYFATREKYDLLDEEQVKQMMEDISPNYVIHAAASAGGIGKNIRKSDQQFYDNIRMNSYVIHHSHTSQVEKLIVLSSVAVFSPNLKIAQEDFMHIDHPHPAFYAYGHSKRIMDIQFDSYKEKYNTQCTSLICANIFGEADNYSIDDGHVVPALIHKCYKAKKNNTPFEVWGDGSPYREFVYAKDIATACVKMLAPKVEMSPRVIISGDSGIQIKELVSIICKIFDYNNVVWLTDKPKGQMRKPTSKEVFNKMFPSFRYTPLETALGQTVQWFQKNYHKVRK